MDKECTTPAEFDKSVNAGSSQDHFPKFHGQVNVEVCHTLSLMRGMRLCGIEDDGSDDLLYRKINPVNIPLQDGVNSGGNVMTEMIGNESIGEETQDDGKKVPRGSRLTPERLVKMKIGVRFLSTPEKQLFIDILFEYEDAIAFDDSEMGLLDPEIESPIKIHTIPHQPWQQANLRLPKAMQDEATQ